MAAEEAQNSRVDGPLADYVVGGLESAVGDFLAQAAIKGIPIDELEVVFTSRPGAARSQGTGSRVVYPQNLAYIAFIVSPASNEQLEKLRGGPSSVYPLCQTGHQPQKIKAWPINPHPDTFPTQGQDARRIANF